MGFSFNGLSGASVTISGGISTTLPAPSATQTIRCVSLNNQNNGATVLTPTAGKTFYCTGYHMYSTSTNVSMSMSNDGTQCASGVSIVSQRIDVSVAGGVIFKVADTKSLTITGAGASSNCIDIWGYEA